ncbi:protein NETWORKED 3A-like [Amborella trichopoda]|uniref:protein NETWORKED 3A-like n=1 Tax=Amborella trichopoda TaxID=13333 RepID=UPI0005D3B32F|nr:protein NETWORKED 3A-like [Amborella trichopoda]|eukprot:XP_011627643.1 protein NETWORKED 3A-like [Amborella trichopoda]
MIVAEVDSQMKEMMKIIGEDGDSFAQRAEMYFEKRPQPKSMKNTAKSTKTSNESRLDPESMVEDPEIKENELSNENGEYLYDSKKEVEDLVLEEINLCTQFPNAYDPKKERTHSTYGLNGENGDSDNDPKRGAGDSACDVKRDTVKLTNNLEVRT